MAVYSNPGWEERPKRSQTRWADSTKLPKPATWTSSSLLRDTAERRRVLPKKTGLLVNATASPCRPRGNRGRSAWNLAAGHRGNALRRWSCRASDGGGRRPESELPRSDGRSLCPDWRSCPFTPAGIRPWTRQPSTNWRRLRVAHHGDFRRTDFDDGGSHGGGDSGTAAPIQAASAGANPDWDDSEGRSQHVLETAGHHADPSGVDRKCRELERPYRSSGACRDH